MGKCSVTTPEIIAESYRQHNGNVRAIAKELGLARGTVRHHVERLHLRETAPVASGSVEGLREIECELPVPGEIKRYLLTSAQNNTYLNKPFWKNLLALKKHYNAELLIGTYSYNQNAYGKMAVKRGTEKHDSELWFDKELRPYFSDTRLALGKGLVWCGEFNCVPTAADPLSGLETYSHRKSAIFPHAKIAMRSVAAMKGDLAKLMYTTGTVTQKNYIQKKAGLLAEHHHIYGALIVEVNSEGHWWVRQLEADGEGTIYDLDLRIKNGKVSTKQRIEAIVWGDIHATQLETTVEIASQQMLDALQPRTQFIHDLFNGESVNHHVVNNPHEKFRQFVRGFSSVTQELNITYARLKHYLRPEIKTVVVSSNHDSWLSRWLRENDYRYDPLNALLFLKMQSAVYASIAAEDKTFNLTEWAMRHIASTEQSVRYLRSDESFVLCNVEFGMHGHLGPNGSRGTAKNLNKIGRRAVTGHSHSAEIINGLYVAGTSTVLDMGYNVGPSSWSWSHVLMYPNGRRTIITMYNGKWKA